MRSDFKFQRFQISIMKSLEFLGPLSIKCQILNFTIEISNLKFGIFEI
jgi:hypothetical protein